MHRPTVARAFLVFHLTLGTVVFAQSLRSAIEAAGIGSAASPAWHVAALAGVEALAALLFLGPATLRLGGAVLMLTFAVAAAAHALRGELPGALLVYAAGTAFVMAHGRVPRPASARPA
jgi:hypothetical protein